MSLETAFLENSVAPLCLRRDIAMLGLLFKIAHGILHPQLRDLFPPAATTNRVDRYRVAAGRLNRSGRHRLQLLDRCEGRQGFYFGRSLFGLVRVWNLLPSTFIEVKTVRVFQKHLSRAARMACDRQTRDWQILFAPVPGHTQMVNMCAACC